MGLKNIATKKPQPQNTDVRPVLPPATTPALTSLKVVQVEVPQTAPMVVAVIGTKFVIYRFSEKLQAERNQTGRAKRKPSKVNPVRKGAQARRQAARKVREQRNEYFRQMAIEKAIERSRERQLHQED